MSNIKSACERGNRTLLAYIIRNPISLFNQFQVYELRGKCLTQFSYILDECKYSWRANILSNISNIKERNIDKLIILSYNYTDFNKKMNLIFLFGIKTMFPWQSLRDYTSTHYFDRKNYECYVNANRLCSNTFPISTKNDPVCKQTSSTKIYNNLQSRNSTMKSFMHSEQMY